MRTILAVGSDFHHGNKLGLLAPNVVLEQENELGDLEQYELQQNPAQKHLWKLFTGGIETIKKFAGNDSVHFIINGDVTQGTKRPKELVTTRTSDQFTIAAATFDYLTYELPTLKQIRFAKGTGSHVFEEGSSELMVGKLVKASNPHLDVKTVYHGLLNLHGVTIDYAHHGPGVGSRTWLQGNIARFYLRDRMMTDIIQGKTPPKLYLRGHYHAWLKEVLPIGKYESMLCILPSMCFIDDFARQATQSSYIFSNGLVMYELIDGTITQVIPMIETVDIRTREVYNG